MRIIRGVGTNKHTGVGKMQQFIINTIFLIAVQVIGVYLLINILIPVEGA